MAGPTEIAGFLTSIKAATEIAKLIRDSDLSLEKAEAKLKLAELIEALAEAKIQGAEVHDLLNAKSSEIRRLEERLAIQGALGYEAPYYWVVQGSEKDGPFCQRCYDDAGKLIRLQGNGRGWWQCKLCESTYTDATYRHPLPQIIASRSRRVLDDFAS